MSKHAAKEGTLGALHASLARVYQKVLDKYIAQMDLDMDLTDDAMAELMASIEEPSPAMLSAIGKFLKDNEVSYAADEEVDKLSAQTRRMQEMAKRRGSVNMSSLPPIEGRVN